MFMIIGTFGLVFFMLILGFIGETISGMFSSAKDSEDAVVEETFSEYATV